MFPLPHNCTQFNTTQVMCKTLQATLHWELQGVQAGFQKGRRIMYQTANTHWIPENTREFQENIYFCFTDFAKSFDCVEHYELENF